MRRLLAYKYLNRGGQSHNFFVFQSISLEIKQTFRTIKSLSLWGFIFELSRFLCFLFIGLSTWMFVKYLWSWNSVLSGVKTLFWIVKLTGMCYFVGGMFGCMFDCEKEENRQNLLVNSLYNPVACSSCVVFEYFNFDMCWHKSWWIYEYIRIINEIVIIYIYIYITNYRRNRFGLLGLISVVLMSRME